MKRLVAALMLIACGGEEDDASYTLCDGSRALRFGVAAGGGFVESTYEFTNPYGHRFFYVDGRCEFVANASDGTYRRGTLTPAQADALTRAFDLAHVDGASYQAAPKCADAGSTELMTANGYLELSCGNDPPGYADIAADAMTQVMELVEGATPVSGDVKVLALAGYETKQPPDGQAWPFSWPIDQITIEWTGNGAGDLTSAGRVLSGDDATRARQLRTTAAALPRYHGTIDVLANERGYSLFVRDELDASTAEAIASLRSAVSPYVSKPIPRCSAERMQVELHEAYLDGTLLRVNAGESVPCDAQLCWEGNFREESPVSTTLRVEAKPARRCGGSSGLLYTDLQPLVDAFRAGYPGSPVAIELAIEGSDASLELAQ